MKLLRPSAGQVVYHNFIVSSTTCAPAKRLHCVFTVKGELDQERLQCAIRHAVATHESLRTSLDLVDGELMQVVREMSEITETPWTMTDWDGSLESTSRIICDLDDWWTVPRELAVRVVIGRSPQARTLVACVFNHACGDGISAEIVTDLIRAEYNRPSCTYPERNVQFSDYYWLMHQDGEETYDNWLRLIGSSFPAVPQWMLDQKLANENAWMRVLEWRFSDSTVGLLHSLAQNHLCTPFEALTACIGLYFRREDGRPTRLGVTHSGRHRHSGFEVVGLLRSHVLDVVDNSRCEDTRAAVITRREALRHRIAYFGRLPFEEVCHRARVPPGWRSGESGLWEVELNGTYERAAPETMDGCEVVLVPPDIRQDVYCENTGAMFLLYFTLGRNGVDATLRYVDPPVAGGMAERVTSDIELIVQFLAVDPARPLTEAPAFFRVAWDFKDKCKP